MERSKAMVPKYNFKLDLEALGNQELKKPLMKYKTMFEGEQRKEIEELSDYSEFENSDEMEEDNQKFNITTGINSESGKKSDKVYPKLLKTTPRKKTSTDYFNYKM